MFIEGIAECIILNSLELFGNLNIYEEGKEALNEIRGGGIA